VIWIGCTNRTPKLLSAAPPTLCANADSTLTLMGTDLDPMKVEIGLAPDSGTESMVTAAATVTGKGSSVTATFTAHTLKPMAGPYDVIYTDTNGTVIVLPGAVTVIDGPVVFYADPPFVYGNVTTPVTIYTTGITPPLPSTGAVVLTPQAGGAPVDLSAGAHIDPNHPKHVIVDVPPGLPAGKYDLALDDSSGCPISYAGAITVVTSSVTLKDITPPFGYDMATTAVTVDANANFFQPGARAYLAKHGATMSPSVALQAPVTQSPTRLTAIVPALGSANDGLWDLVVVNPDGTIGFLDSAFTVENLPVPVITSVSPGGVVTNCSGTGCNVTIGGANFNVAGAAHPVTLSCAVPGMMPMTVDATITGTPTSTSITITIPASIVGTAGMVCVPTVNNGPAGNDMFATGGTIVVFQPSFNISGVNAGQPLVTARRAPALAFSGPTPAARYLYAIGGDDGTLDGTSHLPTAPLSTVEFALQDPFGGEKPWATLPDQAKLPMPITLASAVAAGPFIYLVGGWSGASLSTLWRAEVLQPADAPQISDADLTPDDTNGLQPGLFFYRVAAVLKSADPINPGGETLAGDEFAINLPSYNNKVFQITLSWSGGPTPSSSIDHWRIYRTSMPGMAPGGEDVVFVTADASTTSFIDRGATLTLFVAGVPQPFGGLGKWAAQPALGTHRAGAAVTLVADPAAPANAYLYAGLGYDSTSTGTPFPATYEALTLTSATGAPSGAWSTPAGITNGATAETGRWLAGAFGITADLDSAATPSSGPPPRAYVAFGPGAPTVALEAGSGQGTTDTDVARVGTGGALTFGPALVDNGDKEYGYGALTATNFLFEIAGASSGGALTKVNSSAITPAVTATTTPTFGTFGPQGTGQLSSATFLPGVVFGPPFFYTVGGTPSVGGAASKLTFFNVF